MKRRPRSAPKSVKLLVYSDALGRRWKQTAPNTWERMEEAGAPEDVAVSLTIVGKKRRMLRRIKCRINERQMLALLEDFGKITLLADRVQGLYEKL